jgi:hypothetical protein
VRRSRILAQFLDPEGGIPAQLPSCAKLAQTSKQATQEPFFFVDHGLFGRGQGLEARFAHAMGRT